MTPEMNQFLLNMNDSEELTKGIINQCDEWITEGWGCDNDTITLPMYAAALLNEALTQDECVKTGESHPDLPRALRRLAFAILAEDGHGEFNADTMIFKVKSTSS